PLSLRAAGASKKRPIGLFFWARAAVPLRGAEAYALEGTSPREGRRDGRTKETDRSLFLRYGSVPLPATPTRTPYRERRPSGAAWFPSPLKSGAPNRLSRESSPIPWVTGLGYTPALLTARWMAGRSFDSWTRGDDGWW